MCKSENCVTSLISLAPRLVCKMPLSVGRQVPRVRIELWRDEYYTPFLFKETAVFDKRGFKKF